MAGRGRNIPAQKQAGYLKGLWITAGGLIVFTLLLFLSISLGLFGKMPSFEELENPKSNLATEIISGDGKILGKYFLENRSNVHYQDLSPTLISALIATEDARFRKHSGVDIKAMFRVAFGVVTGSSKGGGSTITQQLAKNLFPRKKDRSFLETVIIKFKEWVTAIKLERNYSKDEILAMYLNTVDFGSQAFGVQSAAMTYFHKTPGELTAQESALLVGILKAPTWFSPVRNPERSLARRNTVLGQMEKYKFITEEQLDSLKAISIDISRFRIQDHTAGLATYFREYLRGWLNDWCENHVREDGNPYNLYKDGLKIYTTIDSKMQEYAEEAVREYLGKELQPQFFKHWKNYPDAPFVFEKNPKKEIQSLMLQGMRRSDRYYRLKLVNTPEKEIMASFNTPARMKVFSWKGEIDTVLTPMDSIRYYKFFLQSGLMSMDPHTGFVKAYVGGNDYKYFQYDHVKVARRQVGSTFKPFLYTLAMQEGESPCKKYPNIQPVIELPSGDVWAPKNDNKERIGEEVTLKWALAASNNWISGQLMKKYSPQDVIRIARKMGVTSDIPEVYSIALGTADLTLYEMVGAMSTYANKGLYVEPIFITRIEDKNGNVLESFVPRQQEAISEETAYLMIMLMKGVVEGGTGSRLRYRYGIDIPVAGKTGTSQNNSDGWFMGLTPNLVTGVWTGCEDRAAHFRSTDLGQGAHMALPIWALYMKKILSDPSLKFPRKDFDPPSTPLEIEVNCENYEPPAKINQVDPDDF